VRAFFFGTVTGFDTVIVFASLDYVFLLASLGFDADSLRSYFYALPRSLRFALCA